MVETARRPGSGWLVLLGGGEITFGETQDLDQAWLDLADGSVGFVPAASGSTEYGKHFAQYLDEAFSRDAETIPVYRARDARRGKNAARIDGVAHLYLGGGVADHLLDALKDSPSLEAIERKLESGGTVVAMAAAAQSFGQVVRSLFGGEAIPGFGWLPGAAIDTNFDPAHDRRLRQLMTQPEVRWGLGLPAGSALLLGPEGERQVVGTVFALDSADGDFEIWQEDA